MAATLIDRFKGSFDPTKYSDTYTDRLRDVIRRKQKGEAVTVEEPRGIIRGRGLEFDNKAKTVRLQSQVSGTFQPQDLPK